MWVRRRKNQETFKIHNWDYPVWWTKREKNEENEESKILVRKQQVYQSMHNVGSRRREKRERDRKYIWRHNSQKLPKSDERHEHTHWSCLTNTKKDKVKETAPKHIIIKLRQRKILKAAKKKQLTPYKEIIDKDNRWFLIKNHKNQEAMGWNIQSAESIKNSIFSQTILQKWRNYKQEQKINWTSSKWKAFVQERIVSRKWKNNLQNGRKYLQTIYLTHT